MPRYLVEGGDGKRYRVEADSEADALAEVDAQGGGGETPGAPGFGTLRPGSRGIVGGLLRATEGPAGLRDFVRDPQAMEGTGAFLGGLPKGPWSVLTAGASAAAARGISDVITGDESDLGGAFVRGAAGQGLPLGVFGAARGVGKLLNPVTGRLGQILAGHGPDKALGDLTERTFDRAFRGKKTLTQAGEMIREDAVGPLRALKADARRLYDDVRASATGLKLEVPVDARVFADIHETIAHLDESFMPAPKVAGVRRILTALANRAAAKEGVPAAPISYRELEATVRTLRNVIPQRALDGVSENYADASLARVFGQLDGQLREVAKGTPVEALRAGADAFYKAEVAPYRRVFATVRSRRREADAVIDAVVKANRPDQLRTLLRHVPNETGDALRSSYLHKELAQDVGETGVFSPERFLTRLQALGPEVRGLLVGSDADVVRTFGLLQRVAERSAEIGPGVAGRGLGLVAPASIGAAVGGGVGFAMGGPAGAAVGAPSGALLAALGAPRVVAYALATNRGKRLLSEAALSPTMADSLRAARELTRLASHTAVQAIAGEEGTPQ